MKPIAVEGVVLGGHKGACVEVAFDPQVQWGAPSVPLWPGRRGWPVQVVLNRVSFPSAIVARRRSFFVLVDDDVAKKARVAIGDDVRLTVKPAD